MPVDPLFGLATATFAWGLSLASYRWFAVHNGWPMGEWQAHRPGLPIAIGIFAILCAMFFAVARGGITVFVLPLFGIVCAFAWTAMMRVGAQISLLLAPLSVIALFVVWMTAADHLSVDTSEADVRSTIGPARTYSFPAATEREGDIPARDRDMNRTNQKAPLPLPR